jgi:iron complex outermembrane receptor protein
MLRRSCLLVTLAFLLATTAFDAPRAATSSISGTVVTRGGEPAEGTRVSIPKVRRRVTTGENGTFRFDGLPPGHYDLEAMNPRFGSAVAEVDLADGAAAEITIRLDLGIHTENVVVTASPEAKALAEVAQPVSVLDARSLQGASQATLGDTLAGEPGVAATSYAPGASRPVIRGFGGDRIRVLENGVGSGDASSISPDHAVTVDAMMAERIEIVRGPASLLYGNAAVGGVVNVLDGRIPDHRAGAAVTGDVQLRVASAAEERATGGRFGGDLGRFAWNVLGLDRRAGDLETPGGPVANSDLDATTLSAGASWIGERGFVGIAFTDYTTNYGAAVEESVRINLDQKRWDVRGAYNAPFGPFRSFQGRLGLSDYEHRELEGAELGTVFASESWEGRVELAHKPLGPMTGTAGLQLARRDFAAIGAEAYVRPNTTDSRSLFVVEEIGKGALRGEVGLRWEHQASQIDDAALPDRDFDGLSGSAGIVWLTGDAWSLAASLSRTSRLPTPEELYSDGPHVATNAFEIGNPDLGKETGVGVDIVLRKRAGRATGEVAAFWNDIDAFIYDRETGEIDPGDGLPVFRFVQDDARFFGAEAELHVELLHSEPHHVDFDVRADFVRAELTARGEDLPRIPPLRFTVALRYQGEAFWGHLEAQRVEEQERVAPNETTTPGYTWLNATVGYRFVKARTVHDLVLRGTNLTDEPALNHVSRFKDAVPLTGIDVALSYRLTF